MHKSISNSIDDTFLVYHSLFKKVNCPLDITLIVNRLKLIKQEFLLTIFCDTDKNLIESNIEEALNIFCGIDEILKHIQQFYPFKIEYSDTLRKSSAELFLYSHRDINKAKNIAGDFCGIVKNSFTPELFKNFTYNISIVLNLFDDDNYTFDNAIEIVLNYYLDLCDKNPNNNKVFDIREYALKKILQSEEKIKIYNLLEEYDVQTSLQDMLLLSNINLDSFAWDKKDLLNNTLKLFVNAFNFFDAKYIKKFLEKCQYDISKDFRVFKKQVNKLFITLTQNNNKKHKTYTKRNIACNLIDFLHAKEYYSIGKDTDNVVNLIEKFCLQETTDSFNDTCIRATKLLPLFYTLTLPYDNEYDEAVRFIWNDTPYEIHYYYEEFNEYQFKNSYFPREVLNIAFSADIFRNIVGELITGELVETLNLFQRQEDYTMLAIANRSAIIRKFNSLNEKIKRRDALISTLLFSFLSKIDNQNVEGYLYNLYSNNQRDLLLGEETILGCVLKTIESSCIFDVYNDGSITEKTSTNDIYKIISNLLEEAISLQQNDLNDAVSMVKQQILTILFAYDNNKN